MGVRVVLREESHMKGDVLHDYWVDACTIGAGTGGATRDGAPIVFSNSDDPFGTRTRLVVEQPADGYKFVATQIISPPPPVSFNQMHTRGLNEAGFAYTWAAVMPSAEPKDSEAIGIPYYQVGRLLLSRAASVADAIAIVEAYPRAYHGNYLFADASGEIALVEISTRTFHVESRTSDGAFARSNHWISPVMAPLGSTAFAASSTWRYQRASQLIEEQSGSIDVESLTRITSDHEGRETSGYSICAHGSGDANWLYRGGSVSSEIVEPRRGRFWYCYGWPCGSAPEDLERQIYQDRSWGAYLPFDIEALEAGEYVTIDGRLTGLGVKYVASTVSVRPTAALV
jgi:hypothetical protein